LERIDFVTDALAMTASDEAEFNWRNQVARAKTKLRATVDSNFRIEAMSPFRRHKIPRLFAGCRNADVTEQYRARRR
jgi:hypothetical protein